MTDHDRRVLVAALRPLPTFMAKGWSADSYKLAAMRSKPEVIRLEHRMLEYQSTLLQLALKAAERHRTSLTAWPVNRSALFAA